MTDTIALDKSVAFLQQIGLTAQYGELAQQDCFLPGCSIANGEIIVDKHLLLYPGDILHEAGHLAVVPAAERCTLHSDQIANRTDAPAEEMMALAWSYAACVFLSIDPHFVFHDNGYKGGGNNLVENFQAGRYIGVPVLEWLGMTTTDANSGIPVYPAMIKWLRD